VDVFQGKPSPPARPDVKVESLDYLSSMSTAAPFLVAITLE